MQGRIALLATAALVSLIGFGAANAQAQAIGQAEAVQVYAYGTQPGKGREPLFQYQRVYANEVVETVDRGGAQIRFNDDTVFTLGSASTVTLDEFVYNPSNSVGSLAVKLGVGTFRYVSGRMAKEGIRIRSDIATIGVRGTTLGLSVAPSLVTIIQVVVGQAAITPNGGQTVVADAGQTVTVSPDGSVTVATAGVAPIAPEAMGTGPGPSDAGGVEDNSSGSSSTSSSSSSGG